MPAVYASHATPVVPHARPSQPPPDYRIILIASWVLRVVGIFVACASAVAIVILFATKGANEALEQLPRLGGGLIVALFAWAIGEALNAVRDIARNSFR